MSKELEIKLRVAPSERERILQHPLLAEKGGTKKRVISTYYDTPTLALRKKGISYRVRLAGDRWLQTVKGEGKQVAGFSSRDEFEVPIASAQPDFQALSGSAFASQVQPFSSQLQPIFTTDFQRTKWIVTRESTQVEVVFDDGEIKTPTRSAPLTEMELELMSGAVTPLLLLAREFAASLPLSPELLSKAARGYRLAGHHLVPKNIAALTDGPFTDRILNLLGQLQVAHAIASHDDLEEGCRQLQQQLSQLKQLLDTESPSPAWSNAGLSLEHLLEQLSQQPRQAIDSQAYCLLGLDLLILSRQDQGE